MNIDYAILGTEETDSGDTAKRSGNEFVYQMQAMQNIETMNAYGVKKIITCNPHDFNIIKNEYKGLGGDYQVEHHTQFIARMVEERRLSLPKIKGDNVYTFHDPCYLGRGNGEYMAPREILKKLGVKLVEMPRNKSNALCCGAGGGQMFKESEKGDKEIYMERSEEALKTNASKIISACPFCMTMLTDGVKYQEKETEVENLDIVELIVREMEDFKPVTEVADIDAILSND
jgi:Fe-S oxidoreductase